VNIQIDMETRHGVSSIPDLESMVNSRIDYLKKMELELRNLELELRNFELELNPDINLPFLQH